MTPQVEPDDDADNIEEGTRAVNVDDIVPDTRKYLLPHVPRIWMMIFRLFRRWPSVVDKSLSYYYF